MESMQQVPQKIFLGILSLSVLLVLIYPWILILIIISSAAGYLAIAKFDSYSERLEKLIHNLTGFSKSASQQELSSIDPSVPTDPLQQQLLLVEAAAAVAANNALLQCKVCSERNCKRDDEHKHHHQLSHEHSPSRAITPGAFDPQPYQLPKVDDLKVDARLDASISKFCTTVFDYYISNNWAPYETRKQLKLAFKKLLNILGERINSRFIVSSEQSPERFCKEKLVPLLMYYLNKVTTHYGGSEGAESIFPQEDQKRARLKIRKLCRFILERSINEDEQRCRLWMELCVAVLSDGVCWNLMKLGMDKLPEVFQHFVKHIIIVNPEGDAGPLSSISETDSIAAAAHQDEGYDETDSSYANQKQSSYHSQSKSQMIPFLLDNFLDRKDSLEQPDPIVSRWRPTLRDITEETELLYPLIQYLKHVGGQRALAYLQAVLDDTPDGRDYCRRILEVEFLPGFCRSHFFHESMGLSRVEQGLEVLEPKTAKQQRKGHSRSASYGSKSNPAISDLLKIEGGIVEGLPLYFDADYVPLSANSSASSGYSSGGVSLSAAGIVEPDSIFKKKPPLEGVITKFFNSTLSPGTAGAKKLSEPVGDRKEPVPRVGIHAKHYKEWNHPYVNRRVCVDGSKCDIFESVSDILTSSISVNPWLGPVASGWLGFLHPYLKPFFDAQLEQKLKDYLTLDLFITSVDLITDAFIHSGESDPDESTSSSSSPKLSRSPTNIPLSKDKNNINYANDNATASASNDNYSNSNNNAGKNNLKSRQECSFEESQKEDLSLEANQALIVKSFLKSLLDFFISNIIDTDKFLGSLSTNRDYIFLFFIDFLDLLVAELFSE